MNNPIKAVGYRILIKQTIVESTTASGIIISSVDETARKQAGTKIGIVMDMGNECYDKRETPWCKVGDKVMFPSYAGQRFKEADLTGSAMEDLQYWHLMNDEDILGVIA